MGLNVLLRPGVVRVNACFRAGHQQNVFHVFCSYAFFFTTLPFC
jgi:hypothetical protein